MVGAVSAKIIAETIVDNTEVLDQTEVFGGGRGNQDIFQVLKGSQRSNFPNQNRDEDDN